MKTITHILTILIGFLLSTVPCHAYRDLETGVFLSRDPAGQVDGPNVYTYVRQNPWTMFDPLGLFTGFEFATQHMTAKQEVEVFTQTAKALPVAVAATVAVIATRGAILKLAPRIGGALMRPAGMAIATDAAVTVSETVSGIEGPGEILNMGDMVRVPAQAAMRNANKIAEVVETGTDLGAPSARVTGTMAKAEVAAVNGEGHLVRFGKGPETAEQLAEQAAKAEAAGFPHGVSTRLKDRVSGSDKAHRSAPKSLVEEVFDVQQTGKDPLHHTVVLPKPVTENIADEFNKKFSPKTGQ
jgi:hypothetical protein